MLLSALGADAGTGQDLRSVSVQPAQTFILCIHFFSKGLQGKKYTGLSLGFKKSTVKQTGENTPTQVRADLQINKPAQLYTNFSTGWVLLYLELFEVVVSGSDR